MACHSHQCFNVFFPRICTKWNRIALRLLSLLRHIIDGIGLGLFYLIDGIGYVPANIWPVMCVPLQYSVSCYVTGHFVAHCPSQSCVLLQVCHLCMPQHFQACLNWRPLSPILMSATRSGTVASWFPLLIKLVLPFSFRWWKEPCSRLSCCTTQSSLEDFNFL